MDIAVSGAGGVSVLLGNGDGTFGAEQRIDVGGLARRLAVLDADVDIAATNHTERKADLIFGVFEQAVSGGGIVDAG